jgi:transcriptional regulator with XRE-family HTH domain
MFNILNMDRLATTFRARRIALGLSQAQAAEAAGISRGTLTAFENGEGRISLGNLRRLMSAVGLELSTREASKRPTLDELAEHYADTDAQPSRKRTRGARRRP